MLTRALVFLKDNAKRPIGVLILQFVDAICCLVSTKEFVHSRTLGHLHMEQKCFTVMINFKRKYVIYTNLTRNHNPKNQ